MTYYDIVFECTHDIISFFQTVEDKVDELKQSVPAINTEIIEDLERIIDNVATSAFREALYKLNLDALKTFRGRLYPIAMFMKNIDSISGFEHLNNLFQSHESYYDNTHFIGASKIPQDIKIHEEQMPFIDIQDVILSNKIDLVELYKNYDEMQIKKVAPLNNNKAGIQNADTLLMNGDGISVGNRLGRLHIYDDLANDNLIEDIRDVGCVLTAYTRIARALGAEATLIQANQVAVNLGLYDNQNRLASQDGAILINALLYLAGIRGKTVKIKETLEGVDLETYINKLRNLAQSDKIYYVTVRVMTDGIKDENGNTHRYEHTMNISSSFTTGTLFNDTSSAQRTTLASRNSQILKIDIFTYD